MALLRHITECGPAFTRRRKIGALTSVAMEQVEGLHEFFAHYLPQLALAVAIPAISKANKIYLFFMDVSSLF